MMTFESKQECINFLSENINCENISYDQRFEILAELANNFIVSSSISKSKSGRGFLLSIGDKVAYAIHKDNLEVVKQTIALLTILFSTNEISSMIPKAAASIALIIYMCLKKSIKLNREQVLVLKALKKAKNGLSFKDMKSAELKDLPLKKIMLSMQNIAKRDGTVTDLVRLDDKGKWHLIDI